MSDFSEKRVQQQIRNFERALDGYEGNEPFARYLTSFFKINKQMGSKDRKWTSRLCYNYFRLGKGAKQLSQHKRLIIAEYLCETESPFVALFEPDWNIALSLNDKLTFLKELQLLQVADVFPFKDELSNAIDQDDFIQNQFIQPDLFIRVKRGKEKFVKAVFESEGISYQFISDQIIALSNGTSLQRFKDLDGVIEVQDLSSQRTLNFMDASPKENWWDACAASGGKALLFLDAHPKTNLLVSDIRMSILRNLDERFERAGIRDYRKKIVDLTKDTTPILGAELFDGIILDAPCTGSGTWGRSPENITYFNARKINEFASLQKEIARNVSQHLKVGKPLIYITCSVFGKENEEVIAYIQKELGYALESYQVLKGYYEKADSMFVARLIKM
ncbi:RsmB/NOP family class I SAM-dependent RNA methyltransferase [Sphingobacterium sp. PCS056]|uniref:RsmB/NOP family class I SAM-dependent RNA methyltransferase n=1 Tax=Sphingobacterium sp. PCS056 TaxID=2931400 RepID=UPI00200CB5B5|nr:RsmB/NOP family class I SAM-dependent RNA methyltransferase [Sphingobacterium sp. PCS056]UPZ36117.1 RsmB/NOP family class I SAM-dependent RNA methyltransferase [Sphingobacterium sp. PCS056]